MKKMIILTGPTGVGKTNLSIELAKQLSSEIVSADSMQIYRGMDIGTGKIRPEEMQGIPHHMLDILEPDEAYSVEEYRKTALQVMDEIHDRGKMPLVVGGSGLYINGLLYELNFSIAPPNEGLRDYYIQLEEERGRGWLHGILEKVDPLSAERIHPNQQKRIIRALEVYDQTGRPFSSFNDYVNRYREDLDVVYLLLERPREQLYRRIEKRVDSMIEEGLVREVSGLVERGYGAHLQSMQGIGYKEILGHILEGVSLEESIELLKRNTRRYAKRQVTWFEREEKKVRIQLSESDSVDAVLEECLHILKGFGWS
ncbi:MAG: tRNA (adenosine(37)-N6)-dimethylallyltransferase MiaA [Tissierellia bacterium]|nr:tRNA (adenosine(37)-N6)-dimethylallyltransferase MiaA [Tissierellia bacterium]